MRIVMGVPTLEVGGAEVQMVRLTEELVRRGHEVHVLALNGGGPLAERLRTSEVPVTVGRWLVSPTWFMPSDAMDMPPLRRRLVSLPGAPARLAGRGWRRVELRAELKRIAPDVCHAWLPTAVAGLLPVAASAGVAVRVGGWRTTGPAVHGRDHGRLARGAVARFADVAVGNSAAVAADLARRSPPPRRIEVIPNGVELPGRPADAAHGPPVGVVVANLNSWKGHADIVDALASMASPPAMRFVGEGPERRAPEAALERAGLASLVELVGAVADGAGQYLEGQFAVLASHREGLPNAVIEAMAAGLPVISTDVGGVRELVEDGVTGLVVPAHDPAALAVAIGKMAGDAELRVRMGAEGRRRAEDLSWERCAQRHEALYEDLLRSAVGRRGRRGSRLVDSDALSERLGAEP